ncbi:hypothetical protein C7974DRAFT_92395 [Boeremia exigua]|uniref:uncharacterized protein n=1 Tax=Boeremia exigua TaxID=749465 RepID=UPI001E8DEF28|nr:uncharacterized protein C7974DRAFT_92395 [Boeremia exigua]KAH6612175.1 hypothetical protein C7974DRAFT_92395 [Boeremia exigua]
MAGHSPTTRKRSATPRIKLACTSCRAARVRCSGAPPCIRCLRRSEQCRFTPSRRGLRSTTGLSLDLTNSNTVPSAQSAQEATDSTGELYIPGSTLPPLFNDNIDVFNFDDIFLGDTEADLDSFFADVLSLPTSLEWIAMSLLRSQHYPCSLWCRDTTLILTSYTHTINCSIRSSLFCLRQLRK